MGSSGETIATLHTVDPTTLLVRYTVTSTAIETIGDGFPAQVTLGTSGLAHRYDYLPDSVSGKATLLESEWSTRPGASNPFEMAEVRRRAFGSGGGTPVDALVGVWQFSQFDPSTGPGDLASAQKTEYAFGSAHFDLDGDTVADSYLEMASTTHRGMAEGMAPGGTVTVTRRSDAAGDIVLAIDATGSITKIVRDPSFGLPLRIEENAADATLPDRHDHGGSLIYEFEYDHSGRAARRTLPNGTVIEQRYQVRQAPSRPGALYKSVVVMPRAVYDSTAWAFDGPASVVWLDAGGRAIESRSYAAHDGPAGDSDISFPPVDYLSGSDPSVFATASLGAMLSRSIVEHDVHGTAGRTLVWSDIPKLDSNGGIESGWRESIDISSFEYDAFGRRTRSSNPNGTVTEIEYDVLDRPIELRVGDASGVVPVRRIFYDGQAVGELGELKRGNGTLTRVVDIVDDNSPLSDRVTDFYYDVRDRVIGVVNPEPPHLAYSHDNLGRVRFEGHHSSVNGFGPSAPNPDPAASSVHPPDRLFERRYDGRGLQYAELEYFDVAGGGVDALGSFWWHDPAGRVVAEWGPSQPGVKRTFDGLGRLVAEYVTDRSGDTTFGDVYNETHHEAVLVGDRVLEETHIEYMNDTSRADHGLGWLVTSFVRAHDATASGGGELTGALSSQPSASSVRTFSRIWYDELGRQHAVADLGTNSPLAGAVFATSTDVPEWDDAPPAVPTQTTVNAVVDQGALVSFVEYGVHGRVEQMIDATGVRTAVAYDARFRPRSVIENYVPSSGFDVDTLATGHGLRWDGSRWTVEVPSGSVDPSVNRASSVVYSGLGQVRKQIFHDVLDDGSVQDQVTEYSYDPAVAAAFLPPESGTAFRSRDIAHAILYPNPATGLPDPSRSDLAVAYDFNLQGETDRLVDQRGVLREFVLDGVGRITADVTTPPSPWPTGFDGSVDALSYQYDPVNGALVGARSDAGASTRNDIRFEYTELRETHVIRQSVDGLLPSSPNDDDNGLVSFNYQTMGVLDSVSGDIMPYRGQWAAGTEHNYSRRKRVRAPYRNDLSHPQGAAGFTYGFGPTGSIDQAVHRVATIERTGYEYLGLSTPAVVDMAAPDVRLDRHAGDDGTYAPGVYPGFDRYGRVRVQRWVDGGFGGGPAAGLPNSPSVVAHAFTYNAVGAPLSRTDARPGAAWGRRDWAYGYDGLHRLVNAEFGSGTLAPGNGDIGSRQWTLSSLGSWERVEEELDGSPGFSAATDR